MAKAVAALSNIENRGKILKGLNFYKPQKFYHKRLCAFIILRIIRPVNYSDQLVSQFPNHKSKVNFYSCRKFTQLKKYKDALNAFNNFLKNAPEQIKVI